MVTVSHQPPRLLYESKGGGCWHCQPRVPRTSHQPQNILQRKTLRLRELLGSRDPRLGTRAEGAGLGSAPGRAPEGVPTASPAHGSSPGHPSRSASLRALRRAHLVVVSLTVGQALLLIVPVPQKWLLTLGADKVL